MRLRNAYVIKCEEVLKNNQGDIIELRCSYDPDTLGKNPEGRKVRGVIHWVSASHAVKAEVRLYDRLFATANPDQVAAGGRFTDNLNPDSLRTLTDCYLEPSLQDAAAGTAFPVRAGRLFLPGQPGFDHRATGLQPHRHLAGFLDQNRATIGIKRARRC